MIDSTVLEMFRSATLTEAGGLVLPEMQRDLYAKCQKVLDRMGFRWDGRKAVRAHVMQGDLDAAQAIAQLIETGEIPNGNQFAYWPSSPRLVETVLDVADRCHARFTSVLEPSAGEGAIVRSVLDQMGHWSVVTAVEIQAQRAAALRAIETPNRVDVIEFDFLSLVPSPSFDTVLMNPPFAVQGNPLAYVDHIEHAWQFVAPGGVLVSVVPSGYKFRNDNKVARLRQLADTAAVKVVEDFGSDATGMKTGVYMLVVGMRKA